MTDEELRRQIVATAAELGPARLSRGSSGNVSARSVQSPDRYLITPSGVPNDAISAEQILELGLDETPREDVRPRASSEWRFHRDLYRARPDVAAVVHTHPPFSTALACLRRDIPAFHYMVAVAGGKDIRCSGYATFGSQELSDAALRALEGRQACLLANHGMLSVGSSLRAALALAIEVEALAEMYTRALSLGPPALLADEEMERVLAGFSAYRR